MISYVALDVETANEYRRSICSIGLVKFQNGTVIDSFYSLINPEEYFDPFNTFIHGISEEDVTNSPTFPQIKDKIIDFIGDDIIVAHYAQFDINALKDAYDKYKIPYDNIQYICSYYLSRFALPNKLNYKLNTLSESLNIPLDHHNALSDATACGLILNHLLTITDSKTIQELLKKHRYNRPGTLGKTSFKRQKQKKTYDEIYIVNEDEKKSINTDHYFYNKYFCFTGKLIKMTRKDAHKQIALLGGIAEKSVTNHTNILVIGEQDLKVVGSTGMSTKMKKAQHLLEKGNNIEILTENDFLKLLNS